MSKLKKLKRKIRKACSRIFQRKTPVYVPVVYGEYLKNRTALITGGTGGIGYFVAEAFVRNGCNVIITGRSMKRITPALEKLKELADEETRLITGIEMDISKITDISGRFSQLLKQIQGHKIDILVNNAGVMDGTGIGSTKIEDFEKTMRTNLAGTFFLSQTVSNYMIDNNIKGNILNIASSSSVRPAITPYMLSKWGIRGLTEGMAKKFIPYGITVNGIAPGPTATPMLKQDDDSLNNSRVPAGRYCTTEEVANLAVFMSSDMGRMIVGDIVYITGGSGNITTDDMKY